MAVNIKKKSAEIQPLLEVRAFMYDLLRRAFIMEPKEDYLEIVASKEVLEGLPFVRESAFIREGVKLLADFFSKEDIRDKETIDKLHWDFTHMFIGPDKLGAPPWESVYLNKERLIFQEETLKVRKKYMKYGFQTRNPGQEADDHLGLELDFMYRLSDMTVTEGLHCGSGKYMDILQDQKIFLEEHLLRWVPDLTKDIEESASTGFYVGMAKILRGFLEIDSKALDELLGVKH